MNSHQRRKERREFERFQVHLIGWGADLEARLEPLRRFNEAMANVGQQIAASMTVPRSMLIPRACVLPAGIRIVWRYPDRYMRWPQPLERAEAHVSDADRKAARDAATEKLIAEFTPEVGDDEERVPA